MKAFKLVPFVLVCFLLLASGVGAQAVSEQVTIFVEAEIGVNMSVDCGGNDPNVLTTTVGEPGTCLIRINNTGNIDDVLRMEGPLAEGSEDSKGWLDYHFECPGTIGECSLNYSYADATNYNPKVKNIQLSPEIRSTTLYLEATPYRSDQTSSIDLVGYSLTNRTKENWKTIEVDGEPSGGEGGPFAAPGLNTVSVVLMFIVSVSVFSLAKL